MITPSPAPPRLPLILLGVLTLMTFVGPLAILAAILGGPSAHWPPDRALEWVVVLGVIGAFVGVLTACLTCGLWAQPGTGMNHGGRGGQGGD